MNGFRTSVLKIRSVGTGCAVTDTFVTDERSMLREPKTLRYVRVLLVIITIGEQIARINPGYNAHNKKPVHNCPVLNMHRKPTNNSGENRIEKIKHKKNKTWLSLKQQRDK